MAIKKFVEFGIVQKREDAKCKRCGALERHRLVWLYFKRMTDLFDGRPKNMLHIAPERAFENLLKCHLSSGYFTADLHSSRAMIRMDITNISFADETFDVICCSHVLEHIPDDRRAIRELHRVLKSNGWAVLLVPITADRTFEDPSITDPTDRLRLFGQKNHVRRYGPDFVERLKEAGLKVKVTAPSDFLAEEEIVRMGITDAAGKIYCCTK
jgi:SAM-dependent methyltransferase